MATAVWSGPHCSWIGARTSSPGAMIPAPTAAAIGPSLAEGTSGVALFLAHLYARTGDAQIRDTASGAARHALEHIEAIPADRALALYTGRLGVGLATARAARALGDAELTDRAGRAAAALMRAEPPGGDDLMSGRAGAVCGLLALAAALDDHSPAELATDIAASLASRAGSLPLAGMAHGEAGVVHALLEVVARREEPRLLAAAERAIDHERRLFDAETGNWADLRPDDGEGMDGVVARSMMDWADGAPGILLSRRRAIALAARADGPETAAAARMVERWIRAAIATRPGDLSLGSGLTGTAECLLDATSGEGARGLALGVAGIVAASLKGPDAAWARETAETPGLLRGLAGIGLFHLRLEDPGIPSMLAPG